MEVKEKSAGVPMMLMLVAEEDIPEDVACEVVVYPLCIQETS